MVVAESYKTKLRSWKQIADGDSKGLEEFSDFLIRCEEAMKTMKSMAELDSTQILQTISAKLPSYTGVKWCRFAHDLQAKDQVVVGFKNFVKFVKQEAELANDPVFSPDALKKERKKNNPKEHKPFKPKQQIGATGQAFVTNATPSPEPNEATVKKTWHEQVTCLKCNGKHALIKCTDYVKLSADDRHGFVKSKGLRFRCLRSVHLSALCTTKLNCKECNGRHHTLLHGAKVKPKSRDNAPGTQSPSNSQSSSKQAVSTEEAQSNATTAAPSKSTTTCRIVPVILYHKDNPSKITKTYALLDDASDTTFVTTKIKHELKIQGFETNLNLTTMHGRQVIPVTRIDGLVVERLDRRAKVDLPKAYTKESIPTKKSQIPSPEIADKWPHLRKIKDKLAAIDDGLDIGLLIGCNCPKAIKPREVITGKTDEPYGVRTLLGWCIVGHTNPTEAMADNLESSCNRIVAEEISGEGGRIKFAINEKTKEPVNPSAILKMFELDFSERKDASKKSLSKNDRKFLEIAEQGIHRTEDGHYELPLPLKSEDIQFPANRGLALRRLSQLKARLESKNSQKYREDYVNFINGIIDNGYAEIVPEKEQENINVNYIPHHGLYHPKKQKFRGVFNCASVYKNYSLNMYLLQGPDLTNNLVGVLCRFRQEPVAFTCDIEGMFHQVRVNKEHRDLLRFLWWPAGDTSKKPQDYRMTVHLFGATSSPGCANYALKRTADDHESEFGSEAAQFVRQDFYVDDGLKSVATADEAVKLIKNVKQMCNSGGFNLHKFVLNNKEVIKSIPEHDRADGVKKLDLDLDSLPLERTLGIQWCVESDSFQFHIVLKDKPCTRRGILSTISSIFDPLGFVAPLLLQGKSILQELCCLELDWDDPIPEDAKAKWSKWRVELMQLQNISIPRCYKPKEFSRVVNAELHHFSDASVKGYGQCSYLRLEDEDQNIHCGFVMGKSRVAPLKPVTIPRLELTAAVCSVKISQHIHRELKYKINRDVYWTDSNVVLGYINNSSRRFHVFVSNRIQEIHDSTSPAQWRYIESEKNPADEASRGIKAQDLIDSRWIRGPDFLWEHQNKWPTNGKDDNNFALSEEDPEVKKSVVMATTALDVNYPELDERVARFSDWHKAKQAVAFCIKYIRKLKAQVDLEKDKERKGNVEDLEMAGRLIIRSAQERAFKEEMRILRKSKPDEQQTQLKMQSTIYKLDPFVDDNGILRVGGRLKHASLSDDVKHPTILPRGSHVSSLITKYYHERVSHQGKGITLSEIRSNGFWLIGGSSTVRSLISSCVKCRKLRAPVVKQKMCDLPADRLECHPPFTYCAVDYFGPFIIKEGRKELKRYGALFTCMSSRAIHLETASSLETDSFLNALRRFLSRRGPVRQLRSDQGTNFVGARRELKEALAEMDQSRVKQELLKQGCD